MAFRLYFARRNGPKAYARLPATNQYSCMGIQERKQRHKEKVRTNILVSAAQILRDEGLDALTIRRVAEMIEYSAPVIYQHFEGKDDLMATLVRDAYARFYQEMRDRVNPEDEPLKQLETTARLYWQFAHRDPVVYRMMESYKAEALQFFTPNTPPEVMAAYNGFRDIIRRVLVAQGKAETEAGRYADLFWATMHGVVSLRFYGRLRQDESRGEDFLVWAIYKIFA